MKLHEKAWANAWGLSMGGLYVFCALGVALFPGLARAVALSWFHGIDLSQIWTGATRGNFVLGFVSAVALSWVFGWLFAWVYNKSVK